MYLLPAITSGRPTPNTIHHCDALTFLRALPDNSVNCIVTSPPYFSLRDYQVAGQIGLEPTPSAFVASLVAVFREARRVLRDDGTCWVNLGDSYATSPAGKADNPFKTSGLGISKTAIVARNTSQNRIADYGLPEKSRLGMPHRVVFALQDDGWIWRDEIVWHKVNPMPESVRDRTTKAHEFVFLLTKQPTYWYDREAIAEPANYDGRRDTVHKGSNKYADQSPPGQSPQNMAANGHERWQRDANGDFVRNKRSVWSLTSEPQSNAHYASYPPKLIEPCILAGCPEKVCAVCGAPWVRETEDSPDYAAVKQTMLGNTHRNRDKELEVGKQAGWGKDKSRISRESFTVGFTPTCACNGATRPGLVMDMFMGSGTTALVARRLGRDYIGCDLNPEYVQIARDRLSEPLQPYLFYVPPTRKSYTANPSPETLPLFATVES